MNKLEFADRLRRGLAGLPQEDLEERLAFYSEMIEDRIEEGLSEEEAVSAVGSVDEICAQVVSDTSLAKIAKARIKERRKLKGWEIVFLAVGSPIWVSLLLAAFAVLLSLYISFWAVIIALWASFAGVAGGALGGFLGGGILSIGGKLPAGIALIAAAMVCAGVAIFFFFGCKAATKGILALTKKMGLWIKNCFMKKEEAR